MFKVTLINVEKMKVTKINVMKNSKTVDVWYPGVQKLDLSKIRTHLYAINVWLSDKLASKTQKHFLCYKRLDFGQPSKSGASMNWTCLECLNMGQVRFSNVHYTVNCQNPDSQRPNLPEI